MKKNYNSSFLFFWHTLLYLGAILISIITITLFDVPQSMHRPKFLLIAIILFNGVLLYGLYKAFFRYLRDIFNSGRVWLAYFESVAITFLYLFLSFVGCNFTISVH